jgi:hypothetical protein
MPTIKSENKWIKYSSSEAYVSLNGLAMLEETEKIELTMPNRTRTSEPPVNVSNEQNMPLFYELKIRVRKYDFL